MCVQADDAHGVVRRNENIGKLLLVVRPEP
jgi:hypothetical protein